jgi:hypothetical protein
MVSTPPEAVTGPRASAVPTGPSPPRGLGWLALVLGVALGLRLAGLDAPLQQDEYGPLYAVAERRAAPGMTASAAAPLVPVRDLAEVRQRSVLPYGVESPFPLCHDLLYLVVRVLPVAVWSLRLPSLLAGLGCVLALYALGRRLAGPGTALAAALFAAVDPAQVAISTMARPYALANLACVLSFLALVGTLHARRLWAVALSALGYGLALALIATLNPVLLLVWPAQALLVVHSLAARALGREPSGPRAGARALAWLTGCALAGLLLWPQAPYLRELRAFYGQHREYLACFGPPHWLFFALHNFPFLLALPAGLLALRGAGHGWGVVWLGALWLLVPQGAAALAYYLGGQSVCLARYLSYTTLGGALLLAHLAGRIPALAPRLLALTWVVLALRLWAAAPVGQQFNRSTLLTDQTAAPRLEAVGRLEEQGLWREGDAVLLRPAFLEADFLPDIPTAARPHVEGACAAPLRTLWVGAAPKPLVVLSLSQRGERASTSMGPHYEPGRFYNRELAERLRPYRRYWVVSHDWDRGPFLACFLPWLAGELRCPLRCSEVMGLTLVERLPPRPPPPCAPPPGSSVARK